MTRITVTATAVIVTAVIVTAMIVTAVIATIASLITIIMEIHIAGATSNDVKITTTTGGITRRETTDDDMKTEIINTIHPHHRRC